MFAGVTALALLADVKYVEHPCDLEGFADCETEPQRTVIAQIAAAVFGGDESIGFFFIQAATALVLVLAANTAFNGFPLLGSVLAQDRFMPRQLHTRGDKLVFSNGILLLAGFAALLIFAFDADVTRLIQLYIIGVFTSFTHRPVGHGAALEPRDAAGAGPGRAAADAPVADHQHRRRHPHHASSW